MPNWKINYWAKSSKEVEGDLFHEMDDLFSAKKCGVCGGSLNAGRTMSWFTDKTLCFNCSAKEDKVKQRMRNRGLNPDLYEGCGTILYRMIMDTYGED